VERDVREYVEALSNEDFDGGSPCARYLAAWAIRTESGQRLPILRPGALAMATDTAIPGPLPQGVEESDRSRLARELTRGKDLLRIGRAATPLELGLIWLLLRGVDHVPADRKRAGIEAVIEAETAAMKKAAKRQRSPGTRRRPK